MSIAQQSMHKVVVAEVAIRFHLFPKQNGVPYSYEDESCFSVCVCVGAVKIRVHLRLICIAGDEKGITRRAMWPKKLMDVLRGASSFDSRRVVYGLTSSLWPNCHDAAPFWRVFRRITWHAKRTSSTFLFYIDWVSKNLSIPSYLFNYNFFVRKKFTNQQKQTKRVIDVIFLFKKEEKTLKNDGNMRVFPMKFKSNNQNMEIDGNIAGGEKKDGRRRDQTQTHTVWHGAIGIDRPSEGVYLHGHHHHYPP